MQYEPILSLSMKNIVKRFPGILATDNVSLTVKKGQILALVGENGAGKTTLMNILMGLYTPDSGQILINDKVVNFKSPNDAFSKGIGMVHQQYMLVPNMTVLENIALGMKKQWQHIKIDMAKIRKTIEDVVDKYGLIVDPDAYIWQLSVGEQQRVELVKTLCLGANFLILDEPTSALTPQETDELIALLKRMSSELSIIFISHKLNEVKDLSDEIAILRHGKLVYSGKTSEHSSSDIAALMTGHEVNLPQNTEISTNKKTILSIENLCVKSDRGYLALNNLNLDVKAGEIVGIAGVSGNGQKELAEAINGLRKVEKGKILFNGENIANKTPRYIIESGMGYIPEERNVEGIVPAFSISENLILKDCSKVPFSKKTFLNLKKISENAENLREDFDIRCASTSIAAGSLSGGNIQKVILAREISRNPDFLIAVYPIRGLDLGAAEFIHKQLLKMRKEGKGIILISEELEEIMNLSDRIAVIFKGSIQKVLKQGEATKRNLGMLMAGVKDD